MKIAVFSDVHGNAFYFRSCLEAMAKDGVAWYVFLGDAVGYIPYVNEVFDLLHKLDAHCLMGNHEAMLCGLLEQEIRKESIYQHSKAIERLDKSIISEIKNLLPFYEIKVDGLKLLFLHGSPWNPLNGYLYKDAFVSKRYDYDFVFVGHTHRPFVMTQFNTTFVNVGSVGLPRDIGNMPSYAVLDTHYISVGIKRITVPSEKLLLNFKDAGVHESVINCLRRRME